MPQNKTFDIFSLLSEDTAERAAEEEKKKRREELLAPTGVKELYKDGKININKFTCVGGQCKYCIKACPTNALYWSNGQVGIIEDLCVYCGACVLICMVDDCIKVERKREDGATEKFSKAQDVLKLVDRINSKKRVERVASIFPTHKDYCSKFPTQNYHGC